MSTQDFTDEQQSLHDEVRELIKTAAQNKGGRKSTGDERTVRKAYTPEHDLQILALLKEDGRAEKFGYLSTDEKKELCTEMCEVLKDAHDQERTPDSLYYRITKLLKVSRLEDINYRIKSEGSSKPAKSKKKQEVVEAEDKPAEEPKKPEADVSQESGESSESSEASACEDENYDDDEDFLE